MTRACNPLISLLIFILALVASYVKFGMNLYGYLYNRNSNNNVDLQPNYDDLYRSHYYSS